jgi:predicted nucleic acid-binding protein
LDRPLILLDACVLINLCATNLLRQIAASNGVQFAAARQATEESLFFELRTERGAERLAIDIPAMEATGDLLVLDLTEDEALAFVEFASEVDDGEAATIAVAHGREIRLATDDRRAIAFVAERRLVIDVIGTSDILLAWAIQSHADNAEIRRVLSLIRDGAKFEPSATDRHTQWWKENLR